MLYYKIDIKIETEHTPPYFTGAMLRGAFGYALKSMTCINPSYQCKTCFCKDTCLYYDFYEKQNLQHRYRFDIALNQKTFDFSLYLFGESCAKLPYVLSSIEKALRHNGIGKERVTFQQMQIDVNSRLIYHKQSFLDCFESQPKKISIERDAPHVKIRFLTPLRMKKSNQLEYEKIEIEDILRSIYQRQIQIFENRKVYGLEHTPNYITSVKTLEYKRLYRKSNRQGKKIVMDGVLGEMAVLGLDEKSYRLLKIGEIIGVGKQTVFGLGKIKVEEIDKK